MGNCGPPKIFLKILIAMCLVVHSVHPQSQDKPLSACELESLLQELTYPDAGNEMHAASLRSQLQNLLENNNAAAMTYQPLDDAAVPMDVMGKRMLSSLARNGYHLSSGKRNIGAMARLGMLRNPGGVDENASKRSIATLAKNGQLPSKEPDVDDSATGQLWMNEKRNIGALARAGMMQSAGKRNIGSLARSYELPAYGKRNLASIVRSSLRPGSSYKRNMASLARGNILPLYGEHKRNVGALARDWSLPTTRVNAKREASDADYMKRNIGSLKNSPAHGIKVKRDTLFSDYGNTAEQLEPVYQTSPIDYAELAKAMSRLYPNYDTDDATGGGDDNIYEDKRYLGSLVRDGWSGYRSMSAEKRNIGSLARLGMLRSDMSGYGQQRRYSQQSKRHIGALARSGTTPYKSDIGSQSPTLVNDVRQPITQQMSSVGQRPGFNIPPGANSERHDSPIYTGVASEDHFIRPASIIEQLHTKYPNYYYKYNNKNKDNRYNYLQTPNGNVNEDNNDGNNHAAMVDDDGFYVHDDENDDDDDDNSYFTDFRTDAVEEQCLIRMKQFVNDLGLGYY